MNKPIDIQAIRAQFPILHQQVNGHNLIYFDNAATSQKPQQVIDCLVGYYAGFNSNIHRGAHALADKATGEFEQTREAAQRFINAPETETVIFTKGTTEGINLIANAWGEHNVGEGDEIIISNMEHHANIVPWQMLCDRKKAALKVISITDEGELDMAAYANLLGDRTKLVAIGHISNALGTINPVKEIIKLAHEKGALVAVDGAQAAPHGMVDVQDLDCDFYNLSAHKMFGPTGVGVLYGKKAILEAMPPFMGGGEMIKEVTLEKTTYNELPFKFEPGTPNIGDVVALRRAIEFIEEVGKENIMAHEKALLDYATEKLQAIPKVRIVGQAAKKASVISFLIDGLHPFDVGMMLDAKGIAVRTGHHCTQPLMQRYEIEGTVRASLAVYNSFEEIDTFIAAVQNIVDKFAK
jgi:cysteine desulfurase/selenocysteine lyase